MRSKLNKCHHSAFYSTNFSRIIKINLKPRTNPPQSGKSELPDCIIKNFMNNNYELVCVCVCVCICVCEASDTLNISHMISEIPCKYPEQLSLKLSKETRVLLHFLLRFDGTEIFVFKAVTKLLYLERTVTGF